MLPCVPAFLNVLLISTLLNHLVYSSVTPVLPKLSTLSSHSVSSAGCPFHIHTTAKHCHFKANKINFLDEMKTQCCQIMILYQCLLNSNVPNCSSPSSKMERLSSILLDSCPDYKNLNQCEQFLSAKTVNVALIFFALILLSFCVCKCRRTTCISNNNLPTSVSICELTNFKFSTTTENDTNEIQIEKANNEKF